MHPALPGVFAALDFLIQVCSEAMSPIQYLTMLQACEGQQACRDAALDLVDQFGPFLEIEHHIPQLREREESRRAVAEMLRFITQSSDYIEKNTSSSYFGKTEPSCHRVICLPLRSQPGWGPLQEENDRDEIAIRSRLESVRSKRTARSIQSCS